MLLNSNFQPATSHNNGIPVVGSEKHTAALTLDKQGLIHDCNLACEELFKYRHDDLISKHISLLLPNLTGLALINKGAINPRLQYLLSSR